MQVPRQFGGDLLFNATSWVDFQIVSRHYFCSHARLISYICLLESHIDFTFTNHTCFTNLLNIHFFAAV